MELLITVLAIVIWGTVYWPVYLVVRIFCIGQSQPNAKAITIALFWPITVPLGLLYLMGLSFLMRGAKS